MSEKIRKLCEKVFYYRIDTTLLAQSLKYRKICKFVFQREKAEASVWQSRGESTVWHTHITYVSIFWSPRCFISSSVSYSSLEKAGKKYQKLGQSQSKVDSRPEWIFWFCIYLGSALSIVAIC